MGQQMFCCNPGLRLTVKCKVPLLLMRFEDTARHIQFSGAMNIRNSDDVYNGSELCGNLIT
jgi:hypothetical protein